MYDLQPGCNQRASHLLQPPFPAPRGWKLAPSPPLPLGWGQLNSSRCWLQLGEGLFDLNSLPGQSPGAAVQGLAQPGGRAAPVPAGKAWPSLEAVPGRLHNAKLAFRFVLRDRAQYAVSGAPRRVPSNPLIDASII